MGCRTSLMYFKKLIGKKCYLSPIDVNDAEVFTEWLNDMEILINLHNIMLKVYEFNKGGIKCYEKVGFKQIGKRREALHRNLEKHSIIYMDILPNEFYEKWNKK